MAMDATTKQRMDERLAEIRALRSQEDAAAKAGAQAVAAPANLPVPPKPEVAADSKFEQAINRLGGSVLHGDSVSFSRVDMSGSKLKELAEVLRDSKIKSLELRGTNLTSSDIDTLNKAIPETLEDLDLKGNKIGTEGVKKLFDAEHNIINYHLIDTGLVNNDAIILGKRKFENSNVVINLGVTSDGLKLNETLKQTIAEVKEAEARSYKVATQKEFTEKAFELAAKQNALQELKSLDLANEGKGFSFQEGHPKYNGNNVLHRIASEVILDEKGAPVFIDKSNAIEWLVKEKNVSPDSFNNKGESVYELANKANNDFYRDLLTDKLGAQKVIRATPEESKAAVLSSYTALPGDTIDNVSSRFGLTPAQLRESNVQYRDSELSAGHTIVLPVSKEKVQEVLAKEAELEKMQVAALRQTEAVKAEEAQKAAEAAKVAEAQKVAEAAKVAEAQKAAEAAKVAEAQKAAEAAKVAEAQKAAEAAKVAEAQKAAEAAKVAEAQKAAEAAQSQKATVKSITTDTPKLSTEQVQKILQDGKLQDRVVLESIAKNLGAEGNKYTFADGTEYAVPGKESRELIKALKTDDQAQIAKAYDNAYNAKQAYPVLDDKLVSGLREQLAVIKQKGIAGENTAFAATRDLLKSAGITSAKVEKYADADGKFQGEVSFITFNDTRKLERAVEQVEKRGVLDDKARDQLAKALEDCLQPGYTPPSVLAMQAAKKSVRE